MLVNSEPTSKSIVEHASFPHVGSASGESFGKSGLRLLPPELAGFGRATLEEYVELSTELIPPRVLANVGKKTREPVAQTGTLPGLVPALEPSAFVHHGSGRELLAPELVVPGRRALAH